MRIDYQRTGGITGMVFEATIETNSLPEEENRQVEQLVEEANFFSLPAVLRADSPWPDQFHYRITIEEGGQTHTVETCDAATPLEVQPLVRKLNLLARSANRKK